MEASLFFQSIPPEFQDLFLPDQPVWHAIGQISPWLSRHTRDEKLGTIHPSAHIGPNVFLDKDTVVEPGAVILGNAWIGRGTIIRSGAYLRQNVIAGPNCLLGHASEFKNCLLLHTCQVPHFNYVGDSLLGHNAHLGAGVILSNVRLDKKEIHIRNPSGKIPTGLTKLGAIIGDAAEIGCNTVLNPGSIIGPRTLIHPLTLWTGYLPADQTAHRHKP